MLDTICLHSQSLTTDDFTIKSTGFQNANPLVTIWVISGANDPPEAVYSNLPVFSRVGSDKGAAYGETWTGGKSLSEVDGFNAEADFAAYWMDITGIASEAEE